MLKRLGFLWPKRYHCLAHLLDSSPSVSSQRYNGTLYPGTNITVDEAWKRRIQLRQPKLQRDEQIRPKLYYAPEWDLEKRHDGEEGEAHPMIGQNVMTPEKWNYYNKVKVIWPPNYVSPETGLPLLRQVYYCRESIHCSPKRMFMACHLIWRLNVDEALEQLKLQRKKACMILRQSLIEAKKKASTELHVEFPSDMHVAEAFAVQCQIVKGFRRHARERITIIRYRYINLFIRLEEGDGPGMKNRWLPKNGWDKMADYYKMTLGTGKESDMADGIVEEQEIDIAETSVSLEQEANERKRRLKEMRDRMQQESDNETNSEPGNKSLKLTFRSYEPQSDLGDKRDDVDLFAVEKEIADQLADTQDTRPVEQIDLTTLAPRKIDWDLKRDISERMAKLERRTERAMAQLIRERLKTGKTELVDAVNSGAYSELQQDD
uniref:39S ribosomal protein L22, mitochondrial n=1 Tax=Setaria digitata TaxID=48799 RepID=A0A915Q3G9_9BILA